MIYKWNKLDLDKINCLTSEEQLSLLRLIITDLNGKKVNNIENSNDILDVFLVNGILSKVVGGANYWEKEQWYLPMKDFDRLGLSYTKGTIDEIIESFVKWDNTAKYSRTNIYLTISKWLKDTKKFRVTPEQEEFINKSYKAYNNSTEVETQPNDILKYAEVLHEYFKKGYTVEEIRSYWQKVLPIEVAKTSEIKFRRKALTVMKEYEIYKKRGGE